MPPSVGPYLGSTTSGRISRISPTGARSDAAIGFPSSQTSALLGSLTSGVADVAFIGHTMYALVTGGGCSHGVLGVPNQVVRVNPDGSWTEVADLSTYYRTHGVAHPNVGDYEPDGTPYSMIAVRGDLYVVEPAWRRIRRFQAFLRRRASGARRRPPPRHYLELLSQ